MTSKSQESKVPVNGEVGNRDMGGESIVISGISGTFPMAASLKEFSDILYNKINPVSSDNCPWKMKHPEISEYTGKVPDIDRFDSQFFGVHQFLCNYMDPMPKKILEHAYQVIYDAGLSPKHLTEKKVGVYISTGFSDMGQIGIFDIRSKSGYGVMGSSKAMTANRLSYWLHTRGPSEWTNSSMTALESAYYAVKHGICEAAIVGGTYLCQSPEAQLHNNRCIKLSFDGKTKSFDVNADGCAKSEAVSVILIQKAKDALRAYAELVHVKSEFISRLSDETGQMYGFLRNPDTSAAFLKDFYAEAEVSPQTVEYIEACGSATPEADKAELESIEKIFCENRTDPVLVGSVMSNIGHTDSASGVTGLTKVLLGYHNGSIAANLHCSNPRQDIPAIQEGRMSIVTEHVPFRRTYAAVNTLSVTGVNAHALLRGYSKPKDLSQYATSMPRLVTISSRQKDYLKHIFDDLKARPIDAEELALLHNIHSTNISGHLGRGYIILDTDEDQKTICLSEDMTHAEDTNRPLWFVYSGMGSQWPEMGTQLLRIPIFAAAIKRCHNVLEPKGINLMHIITSKDKTIFDNVLNSFVGIAAIQIGLTDILKAVGIHPDYIIGHSVGELGCGYADGCLTAEEMILSAYSRGKVSIDTPFIRGAMAAVGLGYKQAEQLCPPSIEVACHNSSKSCTISGPEESIREFVTTLVSNGIFAKEVPCAHIAYHSSYIDAAGPGLLRLLSDIIPEPKARSKRWVSTSVPLDKWNEPIAKYCSAEYMTNNLLNTVLFEETSRLIPSDAVLIEIAPHGLLQAILKRSLPESCKNIPTTQRAHKDNAQYLLEAIGRLYIEGYTPKVDELYPKVEFPVSTGTPHLSHLIKWNHTESWVVSSQCKIKDIRNAFSSEFWISTHDDEHCYLKGNVVRGRILYPFAAALVAVWDTMAMAIGFPKKKMLVRFSDVHLYCQPILHKQKILSVTVSINRGNGQFEVIDGESKVATGYIFRIIAAEPFQDNNNYVNYVLGSDEIYQHFSTRGYSYTENFRSINCVSECFTKAQIIWNNNWVTLIDGLLQLSDLCNTYKGVSQFCHIRELVIDIIQHMNAIEKNHVDGKTILKAEFDELSDTVRCPGVVLRNVKCRNIPLSTPGITKFTATRASSKIANITDKHDKSKNISYGKNASLQLHYIGNFDEFYWEEAPTPSGRGTTVMVEYAGINMYDVKKASGDIIIEDNEKYYGMDYSGITENGDRIMGLVKNGAVSRIVTALPEFSWPVPNYWSLEEAATVPLAYAQAFYYLCVRNKLNNSRSVLIHGAAGALGQAAISVALAYGCKVYATVADHAKKQFLLKLFPQLNENVIGNSRDDSFGDMILNVTNGVRCDIVLSCVRKDLKDTSVKCTADFGMTVDMVQIHQKERFKFGMLNLTNERSYIVADFQSLFGLKDQTDIKKIQILMSDGIARGYVRPLSHITYAANEAPRAFRLLAASHHRGRVLMQIRSASIQAIPRTVYSSTSTHLIIWDGSSTSLYLVDQLIARGASKLQVYCIRPTTLSSYVLKLRLWEKAGRDVKIYFEDLSNIDDILEVITKTKNLGQFEGIYVTTDPITDSVKNKNKYNIANVIEHLDIVSRKFCPDLKYFTLINVDKNIGQKICRSRSKDGYPATLLMDQTWSWENSAGDVIDEALRCDDQSLTAKALTTEKPYLLNMITAITENEDENATLSELGLETSLPLVKSYLRDIYQVALEDEQILMLTKKRILEIEMSSRERNLEEIKGLRVFLSYLAADENRATMEFLQMTSMVTDIDMIQGWIDEHKSHLFIIPGLEGNDARFQTLCQCLKLSAFVLQSDLDRPQETPQELAVRYSKVLLKFKLKKHFYLLGYEFGVVVALELASILEDHGLTGTVYCVGDGPVETKQLVESELSEFTTEDALQLGVVRHMYELMAWSSAPPVEEALRGCVSWRERVDGCVGSLLGHMGHSAQYARGLIEAAYARICAARYYHIEPRVLRSRLILLRAHCSGRSDEECSLKSFSSSAVIIEDISSPMAHIVFDPQCPAIINRYLDDETIQSYESFNKCVKYII